uniref:SH3_12 domain-containing protein n=1 Tax=Wuchereria bancrofti TaxID=6293 RepID=A0A1I8EJM9_WUCBA
MPDARAEFCLLDRVICVKKLRMAPFGEFGTVIGLLNTNSGKKIDVLFDKPYFGGQIMRSSKASGARLPMSSLINITYGKRMRNEIPSIEHIVNSVKTNYKPVGFPKNLQINNEYSYDEFYQQAPSGSSGCRNEISIPGDNASTSRNKCKSKNSQASCSNDLWYGERSKIEKESSATHDAELAKDSHTTVALVGNRKLQVRPTRRFMDNPLGSKSEVIF